MRIGMACACAAALAGLGACANVGNGTIAELDAVRAEALLVPGRTTREDVRAALGEGNAIRFRSGWETWHYDYREGLATGWDDVPFVGLFTSRSGRPTKELVLLFDATGTLRRYVLQEDVAAPR